MDVNDFNSEHRRHVRSQFNCPAILTVVEVDGTPGLAIEVTTFDLSRGGIGIISHQKVRIGRHVVIEIAGRSGRCEKVLFGTVRQCRANGAGTHALGIRFEQIPISPAIQRHLARWSHAA